MSSDTIPETGSLMPQFKCHRHGTWPHQQLEPDGTILKHRELSPLEQTVTSRYIFPLSFLMDYF